MVTINVSEFQEKSTVSRLIASPPGYVGYGDGGVIDFKNTVIFLTSNLASDQITELGMRRQAPSPSDIGEEIQPTLSHHFKPALLARMQIVPFYPFKPDVIAEIVTLKLDRIVARLRDEQHMAFVYDKAVVTHLAERCTEVETGARNIDHIIYQTMLPQISTELLKRLADGKTCGRRAVFDAAAA